MWVVFAYILAGCNGNTATHGEHEHEAHEHEEGHDHDHEGHDHEHEGHDHEHEEAGEGHAGETRLRKRWRKRSDCRRLRLGRVLLPM